MYPHVLPGASVYFGAGFLVGPQSQCMGRSVFFCPSPMRRRHSVPIFAFSQTFFTLCCRPAVRIRFSRVVSGWKYQNLLCWEVFNEFRIYLSVLQVFVPMYTAVATPIILTMLLLWVISRRLWSFVVCFYVCLYCNANELPWATYCLK